jgi:hypothetical protein
MIISGKGEEEDIEEQGVLDWKADWLTCTKGVLYFLNVG